MITPTPFRFMVKTEGLLRMHVRGPVEHHPSAKANVLAEQTLAILCVALSLPSSVSFSVQSYGKVGDCSPVKLSHGDICGNLIINQALAVMKASLPGVRCEDR